MKVKIISNVMMKMMKKMHKQEQMELIYRLVEFNKLARDL